jgi:hypothetical protein
MVFPVRRLSACPSSETPDQIFISFAVGALNSKMLSEFSSCSYWFSRPVFLLYINLISNFIKKGSSHENYKAYTGGLNIM